MKLKSPNDKTKQKKKASNWPLLLLGAGGVAYWLYNKRKKEKQLAATQRVYKPFPLPAVKEQITLPAETSLSPEARLKAMGEGDKGSNPTARAEHKEL